MFAVVESKNDCFASGEVQSGRRWGVQGVQGVQRGEWGLGALGRTEGGERSQMRQCPRLGRVLGLREDWLR